jgi:hypothetical protein
VDDITGAIYYPGPRLQSIPPVLEELTFDSYTKNGSRFWASCSSDAEKNLYLERNTAQAFAVRDFRPYTMILGKPEGTEEQAIPIRVKINVLDESYSK